MTKEFALDSNEVLRDDAGQAEATAPAFDTVPLDLIVACEWNRKSFDPAKLQELADSIRAQGVMQPILLRPLPGHRLADLELVTDGSHVVFDKWPHKHHGRAPKPVYEIVAGERRWRGSVLAEKRTIPAVIRPMTDQEVIETQLVENLQREDLHPLDEAEGYQRLCETTGVKKEQIGEKVGKSRSYVYQRLHLLQLGQESRDAFRGGKIDASKALLLAGVADPKLQLKALKAVSEQRSYDGATMSVRDFRAWMEKNVLLHLQHAPFDIKDATLDTKAGVCAECPKRTGVNRDVFEAFESPDMCTDPKCYDGKATISLKRIKDSAAEKGMTVIAGTEAKKLKPHQWGDEIKGYTRLDDKVEGGTVAKVLGKDAPAPVIFVDPHTHKQVKVLPTETVGQLLKDKGITVKGADRELRDKRFEAEQRKAAAERRIEEAWRARAANQIVNQVRAGAVTAFSAPVLRLLIRSQLESLRDSYECAERMDKLLPLWGLPAAGENDDPTDPVWRHMEAAADLELGPMLMALLLSADVEVRYGEAGKQTPAIDLLARETGVDLADIQREVKAEHKAAEKAAAAAEKAKKPPAANKQAAPRTAGPAVEGEALAPVKKAAGGRRKLSAQEATSGIADAMQNVDPASGANDFEVGQRVRFKIDLMSARGKVRKLAGTEGVIDGKSGKRAWLVKYGDANLAVADYTELEHVDDAASDLVASIDPHAVWPFEIKSKKSNGEEAQA